MPVFMRTLAVLVFISSSALVLAQSAKDKATALLSTAVAEEKLVGLSAAVSRGGTLVWEGWAGFADLENEVPASPGMVSRIASISKPMTAVAVMQLVEQGKMQLDARLQTYLPEFPQKEWPVLVRQLLNHTSGFPHYFKPGQSNSMVHYRSLAEAVADFQAEPLRFEPGTHFLYTTHGYTLLGAALEAASGEDYGGYMKAHVWGPAGMEQTRLEVAGELVAHRARGYTRLPGGRGFRNAPYTDLSIKYPGGGIISNVGDLLRFGHAFLDNKLVCAATREQMTTPLPLKDGTEMRYAYGWQRGKDAQLGTVIWHNGNQAGASSQLSLYPDAHIAVALLSNLEDVNPVLEKLAKELAAQFAALEDAPGTE